MSWFNTPEKWAALENVGRSWLGTPFRPNAAQKGFGVSCQKLAAHIYFELGALPLIDIPEGPMDWRAQPNSLIADWIDSNMAHLLFTVDGANPIRGDLIGFRLHKSVHHLGVMLTENRFIHTLSKVGTILSRIDDATYLNRIDRIWRIYGQGQ